MSLIHPDPLSAEKAEIIALLTYITEALPKLPATLPVLDSTSSTFTQFAAPFTLDAVLFDRTECEVSMLSEQLKRVFGWQARSTGDGIVRFGERGDFVCALGPVLLVSEFFHRHPTNNVLRKWIVDVARGLQQAVGKQVHFFDPVIATGG